MCVERKRSWENMPCSDVNLLARDFRNLSRPYLRISSTQVLIKTRFELTSDIFCCREYPRADGAMISVALERLFLRG